MQDIPKKKRRRRRPKAAAHDILESKIFESISVLQNRITDWFDLAPAEQSEAFEGRIRARLRELLGE